MISCFLKGGLGNFMFQIATTYSLAKDNKCEVTFNDKKYFKVHKSLDEYKNNIFRNINFNNNTEYSFIYNEPHFNFQPIPFRKNILLNGYFQSEKYFSHNRNEILRLFSPNEKNLNYIYNKYGNILTKNTTSIHVRRGDYLKLQNHHPLCEMDYYKKSIDVIGKNSTFIVFSDDINWCKENFKYKDITFIENEKDYIDLYIMSMCKNNIMANSSFSWWGAWLNKNQNKKIIAPKKWFGESKKNVDTKDLYPKSCIKI